MPTEQIKMLAGQLYDPLDSELVKARELARDLCQVLNASRESEREERIGLMKRLFGAVGKDVWIQPPFFCD
ncbi:MAG TPA: maltose acetyltransferase domain-containing protein, partial [Oligoflexus sp.]|uniref:maltose acetyltransferase domain-containing protein n=1 Tax=Oligoflexus sp. TaxID=1971216 RepID=UPI002D2771CE